MKIDRQKIFNKYNGKCAYCGYELVEIKNMQVDHIIAKKRYEDHYLLNGLDINHESNLNPSCRSCNKFKCTFSIEMFRQQIQYQINKFRLYHPTFNLAERYGLINCNEENNVKFYFENENNRS